MHWKSILDTNAGTAADRIQRSYDFHLNMTNKGGGYNLDRGMISVMDTIT